MNARENNQKKQEINQKAPQGAVKTLHTEEYKKTFLQSTDFVAREGKSVYISPEFHENISKIVFLMGNGKMTISDYLYNVLTQHFQDFREEIQIVYQESTKMIF